MKSNREREIMGSNTQENFKRQMREIEKRTNIVWKKEKYYNEYDGKWYIRYYNRNGILLRNVEMKSPIRSFLKVIFKFIGLGFLTLIVLSVVGNIINGNAQGTIKQQQAAVSTDKLKFTTRKTLIEIRIGDKIYKRDSGVGLRYRDNNGELYILYNEFFKIIDIYNNGYKINKNDGSISTYYAGYILNANEMAINSAVPEVFKFIEVKQLQSDNPRIASKKQYIIYSKDKTRKTIYYEGGYTIKSMNGYMPLLKSLQELGITYEYDTKNDILLLINN
jgi:hypothetical protein